MSSVRLLIGDCREMLASLPAESVQCCVTSPPYWGLRDYGHDGQLGLEATPEEYVARMVEVFREVRRVLRSDGTLWLNLGDSYAANRSYQVTPTKWAGLDFGQSNATRVPDGLKPKDLVGIPWRVAFALQADGWYLRSDVIWHKPNPMPESVTDRPTKAHEYVFLLSKSERYFYDAEAIAEPVQTDPKERYLQRARITGRGEQGAAGARGNDRDKSGGFPVKDAENPTRNARSVWTIATTPYPGAHFATFPPELAERCILAGTSQRGACPACGAPWERVVERTPMEIRRSECGAALGRFGKTASSGTVVQPPHSETVGWEPSCECPPADPAPCVVLDPFGGSGTTGAVAVGHGRRAILCELNPAYAPLIRDRVGPMFFDSEAA